MTKDELYRCVTGCVQSAINDHGPRLQASSVARRIVGQVYALILEERLAERQRCAQLAGKRKHAGLRILLGDWPAAAPPQAQPSQSVPDRDRPQRTRHPDSVPRWRGSRSAPRGAPSSNLS